MDEDLLSVQALLADARSHRRRNTPYCPSCVEGIEDLAARLAAAEAALERVRACADNGREIGECRAKYVAVVDLRATLVPAAEDTEEQQ